MGSHMSTSVKSMIFSSTPPSSVSGLGGFSIT
uniref:Uncharacterized protein n=1 Tax=Rhizophora mucronata TaxID=61149 RepID=A0A2P2P684_RHIMU